MGPPNDPLQAGEPEIAIEMQMTSLSVISWDGMGHSYLHAGPGLLILTEGRYREALWKYYKTAGMAQVSAKALKKWKSVISS